MVLLVVYLCIHGLADSHVRLSVDTLLSMMRATRVGSSACYFWPRIL